jgi:Ca2+-binding RTX toxin-like protein/subtilisin-like proprotein convertase family protein
MRGHPVIQSDQRVTEHETKGRRNPFFPWLDNSHLLLQQHFPEFAWPWWPGLAIVDADASRRFRGAPERTARPGRTAENSLQSLSATRARVWTPPSGSEIMPWMALAGGAGQVGFAGDYGVGKVWGEGIRGDGVTVGVNDNGVILGHADFDYARVERSGYYLTPEEETPGANNSLHGTAVASVIAARADGSGVVGVAAASTLWTANRFYVEFVMNAIGAGCDVVNNSWGPRRRDVLDRIEYRDPVDAELRLAVRGRIGLGLSLVFSAGTRRDWDTSILSTTNHENVITVGSVDIHTLISDRSTPGDAVHVSALGVGNIMANANDLSGASLRVHDGSSYAAAFVSGVVALMYQVNPGLGLRDVQAILAHSARRPRSGLAGFGANAGTHANGGGLYFSRDYGFGLVNAHAAVRLAQSWFDGRSGAKTGINRRTTEIRNQRRIGEGGQNVTLKFTSMEAGEVEHVRLYLNLDVSNIRALRVVLTSPQGTESVLMDHFGSDNRAFNDVIDLGSRRFWGENAAGEWSVSIASEQSLCALQHAALVLAGSAEADTQDDRYVYTDEFNAQAAADPRRLLLEDGDGGCDTFNAACVTRGTEIDLRAGTFRLGDGPEGRIAAATVIETVVGGDGDDRIIGQDQVANTFFGGLGDDTLVGGVGNDTLIGGQGNDKYVIDAVDELVFEHPDEGVDTVVSAVGIKLPENVEYLELTGSEAIFGLGNSLGNHILGNAGNNRLDGGEGGNDTLRGGAGDDVYTVRNAGDIVLEEEGKGYDVVHADVDWVLSSHVEALVMMEVGLWPRAHSEGAVRATGNAQDNRLEGNRSNNVLDGGAGNDTLIGGLGDDTYYVDSFGDVLIEAVDAGNDTVISDVRWTLDEHLENLVLIGRQAIHATGNARDNYMAGNAANNSLDGGAGGDTLIGGLGDDIYRVDSLLDVVTENAGEGIDLIISEVALFLPENVEALVLNVGSSDSPVIVGIGNALDNLIRGGRNNDILNGREGNDILEGGAGDDLLRDWKGNSLFNGGEGNDSLVGASSVSNSANVSVVESNRVELYLGGRGDDILTAGAGDDVILFNPGDGRDTLSAGGTGSKTLSLGGYFEYGDLAFSQSGEHLLLRIGTADQMSFENWYAATPSRPVVNLQVMAETMSGSVAGGSYPLRDQKVECFDFAGLVGAFDAARTATPDLSSWALMNALSNFHLSGSDSQALGGDLAYHYGRYGTLDGIGLSAAQEVLGDSAFGSQAQVLRPFSEVQRSGLSLSN